MWPERQKTPHFGKCGADVLFQEIATKIFQGLALPKFGPFSAVPVFTDSTIRKWVDRKEPLMRRSCSWIRWRKNWQFLAKR